MEVSIDNFLTSCGLEFSRSIEKNFIVYKLVDKCGVHVDLQIWYGINDNASYNSIYINKKGIYILYEKYDSLNEFISDIDILLRANVSLKILLQKDAVYKHVFCLSHPQNPEKINYASVVEHLSRKRWFTSTKILDKYFTPWLI